MIWLSNEIMKTYEERFEGDEYLLAEKKDRLSRHEEKYDSLAYIAQILDDEGLVILARNLGIKDIDDLRSLRRIWAYI